MKRLSLLFALILIGITAIIAQVLLIRELLVTFSGNELSIGIFLANWLFLEALGSYMAGRWASKVKSGLSYYISLQLLIAVFLPLIILFTRIIKIHLGIAPGEGIDIFTIFFTSLFLLTPIGIIGGAQFSFGCRLFADWSKKDVSSVGKVYVYEAIGSIMGGVIATYICLQYLDTFQSAFLLAILNILSALFLIFSFHDQKELVFLPKALFIKIITVFLLLANLVFFISGGISLLHNKSIAAQWPSHEIISYKNSIYGNVALLKRLEQYDLMANGVPTATIPMTDIAFIEDFVHLSLLHHASPKDLLLIGGGIGGILNEILKHPVTKVDYAELDPLIIKTIQSYVASESIPEFKDPRIKIHYVDGRFYVRTTKNTYDVIFINLPEPSTLEINRFYTIEFFRLIKKRLKRNGILIFIIPGSASYIGQQMSALNINLLKTGREIFRYQKVIPDVYSIVLQSEDIDLSQVTTRILNNRLQERNIATRLISEAYLTYKLSEERINWYWNELKDTSEININSDFHPTALYYDLALLNSIHSPKFLGIFMQFRYLKFAHVAIVLLIIFIILLFMQRSKKNLQKINISIPILATGTVSMGTTIVLVLAFQSFYGYIYHWIGLLITGFMVGLTTGGILITKTIQKITRPRTLFLKLELALVLYTLGLLIFLSSIKKIPEDYLIQIIMLLMAIICGFLVGSQFPLANKLYFKGDIYLSQTAGVLYASDLIGAWIGGLLVSIAFVPVIGIITTCLIFGLIKFLSLLLFILSKY